MEKRGLFTLLLVIVLLGFAFGYFYPKYTVFKAIQDSRNELSYINDGWTVYSEGDYDRAISIFEKQLRERSNNRFAMNGLGWSHYSLGNVDEASAYFQRSLAESTRDSSVHHGFGLIRLSNGELDAALKSFTVAQRTEVLVNADKLYYHTGYVYYYKEDYSNAIRMFRFAVEQENSQDVLAHAGLAAAYHAIGDTDRANEEVDFIADNLLVQNAQDRHHIKLADCLGSSFNSEAVKHCVDTLYI